MLPNPNLTQGMFDAFEGKKEGAVQFYNEFLAGPLFIPRRHQDHSLSDQPSYPNDLLDLLGLQAKERVIVPVFTAPELIESWCGIALKWRAISGKDLIQLLPDEWWITINPGLDIEKELSPWEIKQLTSGIDCIPELVEELFLENSFDSFNVAAVAPTEYPELCQALSEAVKEIPQVKRVVLLREERTEEDQITSQLVVGVELDPTKDDHIKLINLKIRSVIDPFQIGSTPIRLRIADTNSLILGVLNNSTHVYERQKGSLLGRFFGKASS
jgi:hypothetical protein